MEKKEIIIKHDKAIASVKSQLETLREYILIYNLKGIYLMDPSYGHSTSIQVLAEGNKGETDMNEKFLYQIIKNDLIKSFIDDYRKKISYLSPLNRKIISEWVCCSEIKNKWQHFTWDGYPVTKNKYYEAFNIALNLLAIYDNQIDYDAEDFLEYKKIQALNKKKEKTTATAKTIIEFSFMNKKLWDKEDIFHRLPMKYQKIIKYSIENPEKIFNEYNRVILQRGLLLYAFWHPLIEFNNTELKDYLKKTGHGWERVYNQSFSQQSRIEDFI